MIELLNIGTKPIAQLYSCNNWCTLGGMSKINLFMVLMPFLLWTFITVCFWVHHIYNKDFEHQCTYELKIASMQEHALAKRIVPLSKKHLSYIMYGSTPKVLLSICLEVLYSLEDARYSHRAQHIWFPPMGVTGILLYQQLLSQTIKPWLILVSCPLKHAAGRRLLLFINTKPAY